MHKVRVFLLLLGLCWFSGQGGGLYAQEETDGETDTYTEIYEEEEEDIEEPNDSIALETDWEGYISDLYSRGDQTFAISLGVIFPMLFLNNSKKVDHHFNPPVGGAGTLAYSYFFNAHYFVGVEIGVNFNYTLGQNTVFLIPVGARTGWQFLIGRFEFPVTIAIGVVPQRYLNYNYTGLFIRGGGAGYFRFNPDWSFGANVDWYLYPQWPRENSKPVPEKNMYANILAVTLSARYHF